MIDRRPPPSRPIRHPHRLASTARWARLLCAGLVGVWLGSCGGGRDRGQASAVALDPPMATVDDQGRCSSATTAGGQTGWRLDGDVCRRSFAGLAPAGVGNGASAHAASASAPSASALFDWAERAYGHFFPSQQADQVLWPYVYRYYPETGNHVAVSGQQVFVQGPLSGGSLLYVGNLDEFACSVAPQSCAGVRPCAAPSAWSAGALSCSPNEDQPRQIASGASFTFVDSSGSTSGSATYACTDGTLSARDVPRCDTTPARACNTHDLQWVAAGNTCTPDSGQPTQLAPGSSYTFSASAGAVGSATYLCDNGLLIAQSAPSCNVPTGTVCAPGPISWTVDGRVCTGENIPASIANGARFTFFDSAAPTQGTASYTCRNGTLEANADASCSDEQRVADSFGGDGGAADGSASGDGTAADGAPIVGGLVRVVDLGGRSTSATTDAKGYFRLKLSGMTPPLLVSVTRPDGKMRRSLSLQPLRNNGYVFIAVTGLTDKLVSDLAASAGFRNPAALTPALLDRHRLAVASHIEAMRTNPVIRSRVQAAGLDPARFDPLHTPFRPDGRGYDAVLDNLLIDSDETGATVVRSADCTAPASWTENRLTCTPDPGESTTVPSGGKLVQRDTSGSTRGAVGYTCLKGVLSKPLLASCSPAP